MDHFDDQAYLENLRPPRQFAMASAIAKGDIATCTASGTGKDLA